ncbi:hypothetical protein FVE85_2727 [Porphyridium purpureum]|uniref:Uncharacterized protein n=1 Tax=Porphyridium purpureum TaxID=35688 RepID=A0A5J4YT26_PORPP|nr:hypothetical protein FVE85_2727 [Porphyridium purpureum]|eukprot:POR9522..scf227_4
MFSFAFVFFFVLDLDFGTQSSKLAGNKSGVKKARRCGEANEQEDVWQEQMDTPREVFSSRDDLASDEAPQITAAGMSRAHGRRASSNGAIGAPPPSGSRTGSGNASPDVMVDAARGASPDAAAQKNSRTAAGSASERQHHHRRVPSKQGETKAATDRSGNASAAAAVAAAGAAAAASVQAKRIPFSPHECRLAVSLHAIDLPLHVDRSQVTNAPTPSHEQMAAKVHDAPELNTVYFNDVVCVALSLEPKETVHFAGTPQAILTSLNETAQSFSCVELSLTDNLSLHDVLPSSSVGGPFKQQQYRNGLPLTQSALLSAPLHKHVAMRNVLHDTGWLTVQLPSPDQPKQFLLPKLDDRALGGKSNPARTAQMLQFDMTAADGHERLVRLAPIRLMWIHASGCLESRIILEKTLHVSVLCDELYRDLDTSNVLALVGRGMKSVSISNAQLPASFVHASQITMRSPVQLSTVLRQAHWISRPCAIIAVKVQNCRADKKDVVLSQPRIDLARTILVDASTPTFASWQHLRGSTLSQVAEVICAQPLFKGRSDARETLRFDEELMYSFRVQHANADTRMWQALPDCATLDTPFCVSLPFPETQFPRSLWAQDSDLVVFGRWSPPSASDFELQLVIRHPQIVYFAEVFTLDIEIRNYSAREIRSPRISFMDDAGGGGGGLMNNMGREYAALRVDTLDFRTETLAARTGTRCIRVRGVCSALGIHELPKIRITEEDNECMTKTRRAPAVWETSARFRVLCRIAGDEGEYEKAMALATSEQQIHLSSVSPNE